MTRSEALRLADESGLDLVEVAPSAEPPVCRIMDYGKFKYEQAKKEREARKGSRHSELREVRMRVKIDDHDIDFKARTARKLLDEGDKVKVSVMFRAREITHSELGKELLERFFSRVEDAASMESTPRLEGRMMSMVLTPGASKRPRQSDRRDETRDRVAAAVASDDTARVPEEAATAGSN